MTFTPEMINRWCDDIAKKLAADSVERMQLEDIRLGFLSSATALSASVHELNPMSFRERTSGRRVQAINLHEKWFDLEKVNE